MILIALFEWENFEYSYYKIACEVFLVNIFVAVFIVLDDGKKHCKWSLFYGQKCFIISTR